MQAIDHAAALLSRVPSLLSYALHPPEYVPATHSSSQRPMYVYSGQIAVLKIPTHVFKIDSVKNQKSRALQMICPLQKEEQHHMQMQQQKQIKEQITRAKNKHIEIRFIE